jgi:hypothetical protein
VHREHQLARAGCHQPRRQERDRNLRPGTAAGGYVAHRAVLTAAHNHDDYHQKYGDDDDNRTELYQCAFLGKTPAAEPRAAGASVFLARLHGVASQSLVSPPVSLILSRQPVYVQNSVSSGRPWRILT